MGNCLKRSSSDHVSLLRGNENPTEGHTDPPPPYSVSIYKISLCEIVMEIRPNFRVWHSFVWQAVYSLPRPLFSIALFGFLFTTVIQPHIFPSELGTSSQKLLLYVRHLSGTTIKRNHDRSLWISNHCLEERKFHSVIIRKRVPTLEKSWGIILRLIRSLFLIFIEKLSNLLNYSDDKIEQYVRHLA